MAVRGRVGHVASAMRASFVTRPVRRIDLHPSAGPSPRERCTVEKVRQHGRSLEIHFDDGLVLHTVLGWRGSWRLYRSHESWDRSTAEASVVIEVDDRVAVCFNAVHVETYRVLDRRRHPRWGGVGPDLSNPGADRVDAVRRLLAHRGDEPVFDVLADHTVVRGLGNADRCEALWAVGLSPFARTTEISYEDAEVLVRTAARIARQHVDMAERLAVTGAVREHHVYGRNGHQCDRCRSAIAFEMSPSSKRGIFWCPGCQTRLDHRLIPPELAGDHTPAHPAELLYMREAREARRRREQFDIKRAM